MSVPVAGTDAATPGAPAGPVVSTVACADCGTPHAEDANFCPHCGQETRIKLPRVFDFLREAADETIGFSGRLPRTLGLLLFQPGRLTTEYIAGHRQRYVRPMRLYLSVSLVFFALLGVATSDIGWIHVPTLEGDVGADAKQAAEKTKRDSATPRPTAVPSAATTPDSVKTDQPATAKTSLPEVDLTELGRTAASSKSESNKVSPDESASVGGIADEVQRDIAKDIARDRARSNHVANAAASDVDHDDGQLTSIPWLNERLERYRSMSKQQFVKTLSQAAQANAPYAVFILMPLAAFWYQLFYIFRGRRYAEHLLHSVHLHCFAFCVGAIALLPWVAGWRGWLFWALFVYALIAERKVYRSGWFRAFFGTFIGSLLYVIGVFTVGLLIAILALAYG